MPEERGASSRPVCREGNRTQNTEEVVLVRSQEGKERKKSIEEIHRSLVLPDDRSITHFRLAVERAKEVLSNINGLKLDQPYADFERLGLSYRIEFAYKVQLEVGGYTSGTNYLTKAWAKVQPRKENTARTDLQLDDAAKIFDEAKIHLGKQLKAFIFHLQEHDFYLVQVMGWPCSICGSTDREGWLELSRGLWRIPAEAIIGFNYELVIPLAHIRICHEAGVKLDVVCEIDTGRRLSSIVD